MEHLNKDRMFAIGSAVVALYLGIESFGYPADSAFFPRVLSVFLAFLSVLLFLRLSLQSKKDKKNPKIKEHGGEEWQELESLKSASLVFCSIIAYGILIFLINYEVASVLFLAAMMVILGFRRYLLVAGFSIGLMLLLNVIFFQLLGVSRPESLFFQ